MAQDPGHTHPIDESPDERAKLLRELTQDERQIVEDILRDHPGMTARECIEHCRAMGL
jgi:hypothetical protein